MEDADRLLKPPAKIDGRWQRVPTPDAGLIVAAARLKPDKADDILLPAMDAFNEDNSVGTDARRQLATAAALIGGETGIARGIDWFFAFKPQIGTFGGGREMLLGQLMQRDPARARRVIERIIRDERLTTLGPASTRLLTDAVAGYLGRSITTEEQVRDSRGIDEAQRDRKFQHLAAWQAALKATVDEWSKPAVR